MNKFAVLRSLRVASLAGIAMAAGASQALTLFDATTYVADIAGTIPGMLAIGGAVFGVVLAIKSTKWGRRAL